MQRCPRGWILAAALTPVTAAVLGAGEMPRRKGTVPDQFMLYFCAPGVDPGEPGDDQGPPREVRRQFTERRGCNVGEFSISWRDTEPSDPGDGPSSYDFSGVRPPEHALRQEHVICHLHYYRSRWAGKYRFADTPRYNRLLERWAEAACRFAREKLGASIFEAEGNERDLVDPGTYRPHYPDWHFFYMDRVKAIHRG
ncbi:MAG: hypothetical protein ACE5JD_17430, partial [Candidatus Methylomirabilia bacterium]